jgi:hypothetical protein
MSREEAIWEMGEDRRIILKWISEKEDFGF